MTDFTETLFESLRRADQRRCARTYLEALLRTPGKKSVRRLAGSVPSPTPAHSLRQFVNLSPWDWDPVMERLTRWATGHGTVRCLAVARAVLPKRGEWSVGVHGWFAPSLGRTLNCQLGLGAFLCFDGVQTPVDWRLVLPEFWLGEERLRRRARIPDAVRHLPPWALALDLVDTLTARGAVGAVPVVADLSDDSEVGHLLAALFRRRRDFVIAVPHHFKVLRADVAAPRAIGAGTLAYAPGAAETVLVTGPDGRQCITRVQDTTVRLPRVPEQGSGPEYVCRLFAEVCPDRWPGLVWISNRTDLSIDDLASLAAVQSAAAASVTAMGELGLHDFEGRSFPGWYHHMTLVSAAYAYQRLTHAVTAPHDAPDRP
ncbi:IS701 family transposase [Streptomyces aurantiogriseus]|uniref:IS701 family transposase n=1 Tax=Streptomyces aurantiogriseus TaxID=66870 RepID=UPI00167ABAFF|nr:transposase [Streptomyces aurantiogriseus]